MKLLVVGITGVIAMLTLQPSTWAQVEGSASDLSTAEGIEAANPLLPDYQQQRQMNLDQLNRRYEGLYGPSERGFFNNEELDRLIEVIDVRSTTDENSRSSQSVGIDLTEF